MKVSMKVKPISFSEAIITMKFMCVMGTHFTKLRLFFQQVPFIINTFSTFAWDIIWQLRKLFAETSELFTHITFQLFAVR